MLKVCIPVSLADTEVMEYPFPRTPHLSGSSVADDDRTLSMKQVKELCGACEVVLQEKLDGTLAGVFFDVSDQPILQKRAGLLGSREKPQYNVFGNWVRERREALWNILSTEWVLFGEWLWQTHAIHYDRLPDYFVAFDLLDRQRSCFVPTTTVNEQLRGVVAVAPELWRGRVKHADELFRQINNHLSRSAFGPTMEGVYVRFERGDSLVARAKFRRPGFQPGWDARRMKRNLITIPFAREGIP